MKIVDCICTPRIPFSDLDSEWGPGHDSILVIEIGTQVGVVARDRCNPEMLSFLYLSGTQTEVMPLAKFLDVAGRNRLYLFEDHDDFGRWLAGFADAEFTSPVKHGQALAVDRLPTGESDKQVVALDVDDRFYELCLCQLPSLSTYYGWLTDKGIVYPANVRDAYLRVDEGSIVVFPDRMSFIAAQYGRRK